MVPAPTLTPDSSPIAVPDSPGVDPSGDLGPWRFVIVWWKTLAGLLVLLTGLYVVLTWPLAAHLDSVPDAGDPLLNTWALSWVAHQVPIAPARLVHANIFYPERYTLLYSESLLLPGLMFAPLQWAGVHPVVIYNLALATGFIFSGLAVALLVLELTGDAGAAGVAAIAFAFLPFRMDHVSHMQLQQTQWIPVALWALHRTVRRRRLSDAIVLGAASACQLFSCVYFGLMLMPFMGAVAGVLIAAHLRVARTMEWLTMTVSWPFALGLVRSLVVAAAVFAAVAAPLGLAYTSASRIVGERAEEEASQGSATLTNYLSAPEGNVWYGQATKAFGSVERHLFPGVVLAVLAAIGCWRRRTVSTLAYIVGLVIAVDVSFGLHGITFNVLWQNIGAFRGLRVPARMGLFVGFALSVLAGIGVSCLRADGGRVVRRVAPLLAAALIVIEGWSRVVVGPVMPAERPPAYEAILQDLAGAPTTAIADLPIAASMPTYMYYSIFHWQNLLSGYSGFFPPSFVDLARALEQFPDAASLDALRRRRARYVVIHGEVLPKEEYAALVANAQASRELTLLSTSDWMGGEMRVYRLSAGLP